MSEERPLTTVASAVCQLGITAFAGIAAFMALPEIASAGLMTELGAATVVAAGTATITRYINAIPAGIMSAMSDGLGALATVGISVCAGPAVYGFTNELVQEGYEHIYSPEQTESTSQIPTNAAPDFNQNAGSNASDGNAPVTSDPAPAPGPTQTSERPTVKL